MDEASVNLLSYKMMNGNGTHLHNNNIHDDAVVKGGENNNMLQTTVDFRNGFQTLDSEEKSERSDSSSAHRRRSHRICIVGLVLIGIAVVLLVAAIIIFVKFTGKCLRVFVMNFFMESFKGDYAIL